MSAEQLVAHRGYPAHYPENSLVGIQAAVAAGARYVEVDVQLSRDGVPVLFHDRDLQRLCRQSGALHEYDWSQLQNFSVHSAVESLAQSQAPLAALSDLVALMPAVPQVMFFIELKRLAIEQFGVEAVLAAVLPLLKPVPDRVCVISYNLPVLQQIRQQTTLPIGVVIDDWAQHRVPAVTDLRADYLFCDLDSFPAQGDLALSGARVVAFETVDPQAASRLMARGVDLVETFAIGELRQALESLSD